MLLYVSQWLTIGSRTGVRETPRSTPGRLSKSRSCSMPALDHVWVLREHTGVPASCHLHTDMLSSSYDKFHSTPVAVHLSYLLFAHGITEWRAPTLAGCTIVPSQWTVGKSLKLCIGTLMPIVPLMLGFILHNPGTGVSKHKYPIFNCSLSPLPSTYSLRFGHNLYCHRCSAVIPL